MAVCRHQSHSLDSTPQALTEVEVKVSRICSWKLLLYIYGSNESRFKVSYDNREVAYSRTACIFIPDTACFIVI